MGRIHIAALVCFSEKGVSKPSEVFISPLMTSAAFDAYKRGSPVAKMFFQGAPRLSKAAMPCRPTGGNHVEVEAYLALVCEEGHR